MFWERVVHLVYWACLSSALVKFCVCPFRFGIEGRMWGVILLIPDHCLSIYFSNILNVSGNIVPIIFITN